MKPSIKKKWVAALRSGEYKQCRGRLKRGDSYCCLGVLRELAPPEIRRSNASPRESGMLSKRVQEWAGLYSCDPVITGINSATYCNDAHRYDFKKIADLIEKNL